MSDPRTKYFTRLRKLRRAARRWSVWAGTLGGATVILLPYRGIGLPDVFWAAAAGGATALAGWRWSDARQLAAETPPPALDPAQRSSRLQQRIEAVVGKLPLGGSAVAEMHRAAHLSRVRGSSVAAPAARLDRAAKTLAGFAGRLGGPAADVMLEAGVAERSLRDLAERTAGVERALKLAPAAVGAHENLTEAHASLLDQFTAGVTAYEGLVTAAASFVAEDGRIGEPVAIDRLVDATDRLRGFASGLSELRTQQSRLPGL